MARKVIFIVMIFVIILSLFSGCSYSAHKKYYSDIKDYIDIWELTGFHHGYENVSPFFPENLKDLDVRNFYCRYDEQLPLGEGIQLLLEIGFSDNNSFNSEYEKIKSMSFNCSEYFTESNFTAYATRLGENSSSEYALVNEEELIIHYIYLQNIPKNEIEFDNKFLPEKYTKYGVIEQSGDGSMCSMS